MTKQDEENKAILSVYFSYYINTVLKYVLALAFLFTGVWSVFALSNPRENAELWLFLFMAFVFGVVFSMLIAYNFDERYR